MTKPLPAGPENMNDDRAERAAAALIEFQRVTAPMTWMRSAICFAT